MSVWMLEGGRGEDTGCIDTSVCVDGWREEHGEDTGLDNPMIRPQYLLGCLDGGTWSEGKKMPPNLRIPKARESKFKLIKGQSAALTA